jgi:hypothetical protein
MPQLQHFQKKIINIYLVKFSKKNNKYISGKNSKKNFLNGNMRENSSKFFL